MNSINKTVEQTIARFGMVSRKGELWLVAVSGGPDSVALWQVLQEVAPGAGLRLAILHFNHRLRGEESDGDKKFVEKLVRESGCPFYAGEADTAAEAKRRKLGIEETARALRYEFFARIAAREKAAAVATGHTLDDQAETVLMRLVRGAGIDGLGGIPPVNERPGLKVVRPLIETTRGEILRYLAAHGVAYRTDSSNAETVYTRNFVRHELLPRIEKECNPAAKEILARAARQHRDVAEFIDGESEKWWARAARAGDRQITLKGDVLKKAPLFLRREMVKRALRRLAPQSSERFHFEHLAETAALLQPHPPRQKIDLPDGVRAEKNGKNLVISIVTPGGVC